MPAVGVAALAPVAEAIFALIVLLAFFALAYLIEQFGQYIPFIGGWLASQAARVLAAVVSGLQWFYKGYLWALQTIVDAVTIGVTWPLSKILDVSSSVVFALYWLRNVAIPNWFNAAINYAASVATAAYAYALTLYYQAINYATSVARAAYAYTLTLYYQAIAYATAGIVAAYTYSQTLFRVAVQDIATLRNETAGAITALATFTTGELATIRAWVAGLVTQTALTLEGDIAAVETALTALIAQYAAAAVKDALTITDQAAVVALTDIWPGLITDVDALLNSIPQELIDIRDEIASIPRVIPGDLVDALAGLGALAIPLLRYLRECGVPMCRDLHGLSDLFGDLNTVATDAALIGLFALMVADPHDAATVIVDTLGPVANGAARVTRELVGV